MLSLTTTNNAEDIPTPGEVTGLSISRMLRQASPRKITFMTMLSVSLPPFPSFFPALSSFASVYCRCPENPEESVGSSPAGATGSFESLGVGVGN